MINGTCGVGVKVGIKEGVRVGVVEGVVVVVGVVEGVVAGVVDGVTVGVVEGVKEGTGTGAGAGVLVGVRVVVVDGEGVAKAVGMATGVGVNDEGVKLGSRHRRLEEGKLKLSSVVGVVEGVFVAEKAETVNVLPFGNTAGVRTTPRLTAPLVRAFALTSPTDSKGSPRYAAPSVNRLNFGLETPHFAM